MGIKKIAILIPSYKRPEVLNLTLKGLLETVDANLYDIRIGVCLNQATQKEISVTDSFKAAFREKGLSLAVIEERTNIGKAVALNELFDSVVKGIFQDNEYVITLDNDMLLKIPWMHLIKDLEDFDFELMGFGSSLFWCHLPSRDLCTGQPFKKYTLYPLHSIAGGMMLFPYSFLKNQRWTNNGGVYGEDDATMCTKANKKYVLAWDYDWLQHDPLLNSTEELKRYQSKKEALYSNSRFVFPVGWDE